MTFFVLGKVKNFQVKSVGFSRYSNFRVGLGGGQKGPPPGSMRVKRRAVYYQLSICSPLKMYFQCIQCLKN